MSDLNTLAETATRSGREMATELGGRIGVKRLIEIWEQHQADVRLYIKALNKAHDDAGSTLNKERD